jgi:hypothetical protein
MAQLGQAPQQVVEQIYKNLQRLELTQNPQAQRL